ncbi:MAG: phage/plasmid primase, P4 family [Rhodospirillaceae bacterium]|nr:phage/plasmid primase, P4 family [Rhodospirillaceae bacterium]
MSGDDPDPRPQDSRGDLFGADGAQSESDIDARLQAAAVSGVAAIRQALETARPWTPLDLEMARLERNDKGNAMRMARRFKDRALYVKGVGWHGWARTHWDFARGAEIAAQTAAAVQDAMMAEVKALIAAGRWPNEKPADFDKRIGAAFGWAIQSGNAHRRDAMLTWARPDLTVLPDEMDSVPLLFNCANGTLDLTDPARVKLRKARPADLISRASPVRYDPTARCPQFDAFMARILPELEVRLFVQRWAGYLLTGDTSEQVVALWHGEGANGKSTLADLMKFILADYAKTVAFASLVRGDRSRGGSEATPDIARLRGARAAFASEPEHNVSFSEGLIKSLTGEASIVARHLNQEFFEYTPRFKITLSFNTKPKVVGADLGIWRRLLLVPFGVIIPKEDRDKQLLDKLKGEAAGVLNWMLDGYRAWRDRGLAPPAAVVAATDEYKAESDPIGLFIADAVEIGRVEDELEAGVAFRAYQAWCRANGQFPFGQTGFGRRFGKAFHKDRSSTHGRIVYFGAVLKPEWRPRDGGGYGGDAPPPDPAAYGGDGDGGYHGPLE